MPIFSFLFNWRKNWLPDLSTSVRFNFELYYRELDFRNFVFRDEFLLSFCLILQGTFTSISCRFQYFFYFSPLDHTYKQHLEVYNAVTKCQE